MDVPVVDTEDLSLVILAHGLGEMAKVAVPETVPVPVPPDRVGFLRFSSLSLFLKP